MMTPKCLSVEQTKKKLQAENVLMADVREMIDYEKSRIKNASTLGNANFISFVKETDKATPIVVYCYHGVSSKHVASYLLNQGFEDVYSMDGGFAAWCQAGYPVLINEGEIA